MKIKVIETGSTEFTASTEWTEPAIRGALASDDEVDAAVGFAIVDTTDMQRDTDTDEYVTVTEDDGAVLWSGWLTGDKDKPAPDGADEYRNALAEIQAIFDGDQEMTADLLSADPDQQSAEEAALTAISGIILRVLAGEAANS